MDQQIVQQMVTAITPELWILFLQMSASGIAGLIVYQLLKNVAAYINLRFDKEFGKNVKVVYKGQMAYVDDINLKHLILRLENGNDVLIPITKVSNQDWELVRNGNRGK
jgi:hypothetical protein